MNQHRMKTTRIAIAVLLGALGAASAIPAYAETEVEALKRELAEQRALIEKLLAAQNTQKEAIEKIETRATQAPAQASAQAPAQAGSNVVSLPKGLSLYGTLDVNLANTNSGYGGKTTVGSGGMTASSIGLKGEKEVLSGVRAIGEVEIGIDLSTGVAGNGPNTNGINNTVVSSGGFLGNGNQLFSRQAYAGLASDTYGQITLGRQYTASYLAAAIDGTAFGPGFYGSSVTFLPIIGGMPTRVNNAIVYRSPSFSGFYAYATYTAGSENNVNETIVSGTSRVTDSSGSGWDLGLFYRSKTLTAALTAWDVYNASFAENETGLAKKKGWQAVVNYDFGPVKLYGNYVSGRITGGNYENITKTMSKADGWGLSLKVPFGNHSILAGYTRVDDKSLLNRDGSLVGIAYTYKLYDATWLYVNYGKQINNSNASYSLMNGGDLVGNVAKPGYNPSGVMMGLNTKF
ncbi:MAG: porin [Betaproteobacteria bacterium]|nr:porin [Betaproteobacteria bacterium]